MAVVQTTKLAN